MPRLNTQLEAEGAEFLVVGELLIRAVPAFKNHSLMPGYDVVATNPEKNTSARISVKSRWDNTASGFIIKNLSCDFVVVVKLNRGRRGDVSTASAPQFYVLPVSVVEKAPRTEKWNKVNFKGIPNFEDYLNRWDLVKTYLSKQRRIKKTKTS